MASQWKLVTLKQMRELLGDNLEGWNDPSEWHCARPREHDEWAGKRPSYEFHLPMCARNIWSVGSAAWLLVREDNKVLPWTVCLECWPVEPLARKLMLTIAGATAEEIRLDLGLLRTR